jgi:hypothetical protein
MPPKPSNISNITNQIAFSIWVGLRLFSPIWVDFIYLGWIFGLFGALFFVFLRHLAQAKIPCRRVQIEDLIGNS